MPSANRLESMEKARARPRGAWAPSSAIFEKEGHVTAPFIQQYAGIEVDEADKRLEALSKEYKWRIRQAPQNPESIRYSMARASKAPAESNPPS